jgi:DNA-binding MarR family transcriptional regulator
MNDQPDASTATASEAEITLGLLNAIEENSAVTQRTVASELGIALGLANSYLKRCVRKGLIKVHQAPANRYAYYLTPKGFAEKSRLTALYLASSFSFFRGARSQCAALMAECEARKWRRAALAGASELAEIAALCARDYPIELVGIVDPDSGNNRFAGLPVVSRLKELGPVSVVIVTDLRSPQSTYDALIDSLPPERVLTPRLLGISRVKPQLAEEEGEPA